ncbi:MAG: PDZ domain-containing protein [Isosphaeraceae bacterium]
MISQVRGNGRIPLQAFALVVGFWVSSVTSTVTRGDEPEGTCHLCGKIHRGACGPGYGTLGYGPPGDFPGYQGFSLKYHLGYGYGRKALGVGAFGGYPFYGGPGYPHPWPKLRRFCGIAPFPYYGGPGYSGFGYCNFYDEPGHLVVNENVVTEGARGTPGTEGGYGFGAGAPGDYGIFTGALPYPESYFAPYTAAAAAMGAAAPRPSSPAGAPTNITTSREFGIDEEPVVEADGVQAIKVSQVYPGTLAQKASLQPGDVIHSINHYVPTRPDDLGRIIANARPGSDLVMYVRKLSDGKEHVVTVQLP